MEKTPAFSVRTAFRKELDSIHALGLATPQLKVDGSDFMTRDELLDCIGGRHSIFLVAVKGVEQREIVGFIYANLMDAERPAGQACLVYLAVSDQHRRQGIANALYDECMSRLAKCGARSIYGWANLESPEIVGFLEKKGWHLGKHFAWASRNVPER